jgi:predicted phage terminase large subunit-like protein
VDQVSARAHPAALASWCDPDFARPPHVELASRAIRDAVVAGDGRLIVCEPPRHGKSTLCDQWTPVWALDLWPHKRVALASNESSLSEFWGRRTLGTVKRHGPDGDGRLMVRLSEAKSAAGEWETPEGGGFFATGIGGAFTGRGADVLIIDDPVKNPEQANSQAWRDKCWEWYAWVARPRLEPGGTVIVVMTRWNLDDLAGRLLEKDKERTRWRRLVFPAIAEEADELGREPGDPLWPERFDLAALEEIRTGDDGVSPYAWESLYQQRPAPPGGAVFMRQHFRYYRTEGDVVVLEEEGRECRYALDEIAVAQTVDTAMTEKETSDYTVVWTFGVTPRGDVLVLEVARKRVEVPDQWDFVESQRRKWRAKAAKYRWIGCESKGSGIGLLQLAKRRGVPMRELEAVKDKVTRASDAATMYQRGCVRHPKDAPWLAAYERELCEFPYGPHDDQVDTAAYGCRAIREGTAWWAAGAGESKPGTPRSPADDDDDEEEPGRRTDRPWGY